jgi:hypothetical protein
MACEDLFCTKKSTIEIVNNFHILENMCLNNGGVLFLTLGSACGKQDGDNVKTSYPSTTSLTTKIISEPIEVGAN